MISYRVYNPAPPASYASGLSRTEQVVTAAIYSRHHDGLVRQRALATLLDFDEPWTAPFIVQLLGEYVIQVNHAKRYADLQKRTSLTSETALGGRCKICGSRTREIPSSRQGSDLT